MAGVARAVQFRRDTSPRHYALAARTVLAMAGALLSIAGIVLAAGGLLSTFDGSAFYSLAGLGLIVSGVLLAMRNRAGLWTYLAVFAGTVSWSLRNIDCGSSVPYRLVGPAVLLAMLAVLTPILLSWRPRSAAIAFSAIMIVTVGVAEFSTAGNPLSNTTATVTRFLDSTAKGLLQ